MLLPTNSNSTHTSCFHRKVKSPYVLQYLAFEERINSIPAHKSHSFKHPLTRTKTLPQDSDNSTLKAAKELIKNRRHLWQDEKENQLSSIDDQHLSSLKDKLERIKNINHLSEKSTPLDSHQASRQKSHVPKSFEEQRRSRAISEMSLGVRQASKQGPLNFLQYKKSRRELSMKLKRM